MTSHQTSQYLGSPVSSRPVALAAAPNADLVPGPVIVTIEITFTIR
ncbi:MAG TPA: hypothetical protein VMS04_10045 [Vicinamibacterales bacterium]|jgi:hypothetical protein|nr:hypothetical protein [Vicinamibacterales bacterium]